MAWNGTAANDGADNTLDGALNGTSSQEDETEEVPPEDEAEFRGSRDYPNEGSDDNEIDIDERDAVDAGDQRLPGVVNESGFIDDTGNYRWDDGGGDGDDDGDGDNHRNADDSDEDSDLGLDLDLEDQGTLHLLVTTQTADKKDDDSSSSQLQEEDNNDNGGDPGDDPVDDHHYNHDNDDNDDDNDTSSRPETDDSDLDLEQQATLELLMQMQQSGTGDDSSSSLQLRDDDGNYGDGGGDGDGVDVDNECLSTSSPPDHLARTGGRIRSARGVGTTAALLAIVDERVTRKGRRLAKTGEGSATQHQGHDDHSTEAGEEPEVQPGAVQRTDRPHGLNRARWRHQREQVRSRTQANRDEARRRFEEQREEQMAWKLVEGFSATVQGRRRYRPAIHGELMPESEEETSSENGQCCRNRTKRVRISVCFVFVVAIVVVGVTIGVLLASPPSKSKQETDPEIVPTGSPSFPPFSTTAPTSSPSGESGSVLDIEPLYSQTSGLVLCSSRCQLGQFMSISGIYSTIGAPYLGVRGALFVNSLEFSQQVTGDATGDFVQIGRSVDSIRMSNVDVFAGAGRRAIRFFTPAKFPDAILPADLAEINSTHLFSDADLQREVKDAWSIENLALATTSNINGTSGVMIVVAVAIQAGPGINRSHDVITLTSIQGSMSDSLGWRRTGQRLQLKSRTNVQMRLSHGILAIVSEHDDGINQTMLSRRSNVSSANEGFSTFQFDDLESIWIQKGSVKGSFRSMDLAVWTEPRNGELGRAMFCDQVGMLHFFTMETRGWEYRGIADRVEIPLTGIIPRAVTFSSSGHAVAVLGTTTSTPTRVIVSFFEFGTDGVLLPLKAFLVTVSEVPTEMNLVWEDRLVLVSFPFSLDGHGTLRLYDGVIVKY